jgi:hypothetical protein
LHTNIRTGQFTKRPEARVSENKSCPAEHHRKRSGRALYWHNMATATSHEHHNNRHLPPSPPSSPHSTRRRHKKRHDSFEALANSSIPSPPSSPSHGPVTDDDQGTLLERVTSQPHSMHKHYSNNCRLFLHPYSSYPSSSPSA